MPLTGMDIYKQLPKTNCKDCKLPTCMAFAMQVAAKQRPATDCPHLSEEAKAALSDASSPPMKLVTIGSGQNAFVTGKETVMFRHEEKFFHPCGIAVKVPASLSMEEASARIERINNTKFVRVGKTIRVSLCAIDVETDNPAERAKLAMEKSEVPLIIMARSKEKAKEAIDAVKQAKPLLYKADASSFDAFLEIAIQAKVPLAVSGSSLEELAGFTQKAREKGFEDMLLAFDSKNPGATLRNLTTARRAALKRNYRPLGYPAIVDVEEKPEDMEGILAGGFAIKYAGIVMLGDPEPARIFPMLASIYDVYNDPQVPNMVEAKLYEIGNPNEGSPVLMTTNFALTYFSVAGEVERSKIPSYICVVNTEGLGILNSYAGDKISAEKMVKTLVSQLVGQKVKHRKLIIPGLIPIFKGEIEDISEWKEVIIGPETSREIPAFLAKAWK